MLKKLLSSLLLATCYLLLVACRSATAAGSPSETLVKEGSDTTTQNSPDQVTNYQLPVTSYQQGINLSTSEQPTTTPEINQSHQLQTIKSLAKKLAPNTANFPLTIPITTATSQQHLTNLSLQSQKFLVILHIQDIHPNTQTSNLKSLALRLNHPQVTWTTTPLLIFDTQPAGQDQFVTTSAEATDSATLLEEASQTYQHQYQTFTDHLDPDKYTLIPAELLLRSSDPSPTDWIDANLDLYLNSPAIALYANHYQDHNQDIINHILKTLTTDDHTPQLFFSSFNYSATSAYQHQLDLLSDPQISNLTSQVSFINISIPTHCGEPTILFYLDHKIFNSLGAEHPEDCYQTLSVKKVSDAGVDSLGRFISALFSMAIIVAVIFVFLMLIWGGFNWISAGGDKDKVTDARTRITNALIGLTIVAAAWALTKVIGLFFGVDITNMLIPSAAPTLL